MKGQSKKCNAILITLLFLASFSMMMITDVKADDADTYFDGFEDDADGADPTGTWYTYTETGTNPGNVTSARAHNGSNSMYVIGALGAPIERQTYTLAQKTQFDYFEFYNYRLAGGHDLELIIHNGTDGAGDVVHITTNSSGTWQHISYDTGPSGFGVTSSINMWQRFQCEMNWTTSEYKYTITNAVGTYSGWVPFDGSGDGGDGVKALYFYAGSTADKTWYDDIRFWNASYPIPNRTPVFSNELPVNGTGNLWTSLDWYVNISDPDGDLFNWSIECSNGQNDSGNDATNGTKALFTINGLLLDTTYTIWVNATDGILSTSEWFLFTTRDNINPYFSDEDPVNESTNQTLSLTWSINISDDDGDNFTWSIFCSNGDFNASGGEGDIGNGTVSLNITGLSYSTEYTVWVNATDTYGNTSEWFTFTTLDAPPLPPPPTIYETMSSVLYAIVIILATLGLVGVCMKLLDWKK